jgi:hypothetical protein
MEELLTVSINFRITTILWNQVARLILHKIQLFQSLVMPSITAKFAMLINAQPPRVENGMQRNMGHCSVNPRCRKKFTPEDLSLVESTQQIKFILNTKAEYGLKRNLRLHLITMYLSLDGVKTKKWETIGSCVTLGEPLGVKKVSSE